MKTKICTLIAIIHLIPILAFAEDTINGIVMNAETNEALENVNVYVKDKPIGTTTDMDGYFTLSGFDVADFEILVFDHISFDTLQITIAQAKKQNAFFLKSKLMETNQIIVEANRPESEISRDLPQDIAVIEAKQFEGRGYIDVGDLLNTENSIQIEEDESGRKTLSLRGGNAEDVAVYYNGIRMNSNYNNVFDIALLNVEDIQQIEIIKGSNTALFGGEAFSGVINIVPKTDQDYTVRFFQKVGSYNSGDWNLHFNNRFFDRLLVSFNFKDAARKRLYTEGAGKLLNDISHISANIIYSLNDPESDDKNELSFMFMKSGMDYKNTRILENIEDKNEIISLQYNGSIGPTENWRIVTAVQNLDNTQNLSNAITRRNYLNKSYIINIEKEFEYELVNLIAAYQFENAKLDFEEDYDPEYQNIGIKSGLLSQEKHGAVLITKFHTPTGVGVIDMADVDISYRYDYIENKHENIITRRTENVSDSLHSWTASSLKFSTIFKGTKWDLQYSFFISAGTNVKFPTLFYQLSRPAPVNNQRRDLLARLKPEKNRSIELGVEFFAVYPERFKFNGWHFRGSYFNNAYENKFRAYYLPEIPIAFYDNVQNANISGIDIDWSGQFFNNRISTNIGLSNYFIDDKTAFPFKSELSYKFGLTYTYNSFVANALYTGKSEQEGWVRGLNADELYSLPLDGYASLDIHLNKRFEFKNITVITSLSGRNILDDRAVLEGISINDRRFYLGFGVEY